MPSADERLAISHRNGFTTVTLAAHNGGTTLMNHMQNGNRQQNGVGSHKIFSFLMLMTKILASQSI
jgi:hypothetical protein